MPEHVRIFVDFWNFQLEWNDRTQGQLLDWVRLPQILVQEAMSAAGIDDYQYHGTKVYASVDVTTDEGKNLRNWLNNFLDRQVGINTHIKKVSHLVKGKGVTSCIVNKMIDLHIVCIHGQSMENRI